MKKERENERTRERKSPDHVSAVNEAQVPKMESPKCLCSAPASYEETATGSSSLPHSTRQCALLNTDTTQLLEQLNSQTQSKLEIGKMAGPTRPPFRRRVNRPQRRQWFRFRNNFQWPRFDRDMKVCGILVVPVLGILALLAVWVYIAQQAVRDHVVYYILDTDQSWMGLLVEGIIALALFGVLMRVVGRVNSE